jgi:hypothetical protein
MNEYESKSPQTKDGCDKGITRGGKDKMAGKDCSMVSSTKTSEPE